MSDRAEVTHDAMDEFGNILGRAVTGGGGSLPQAMALAVDRGSNRLAGAGYAYDVLGNLVTMPAADGVGTVSMTYLDQGHIGTLTDAAGVVWKYYYDADGKRRIKVKTAGGAATEPDGQGGVRLVADRSYYFYEGEDLICQQDVGALVQDESQYEPKFLLLDHLGSTRAELVFDPVSLAPQIQEYYDLMPYGEVIDPPTTQESVLFTGKPRDIESGLDEFGPRKLSSSFCRWISADPPFVDNQIESPQSWNLYTYVRNNPMNYVDPSGFRELNDEDWAALEKLNKQYAAAYDSGNTDLADSIQQSSMEIYDAIVDVPEGQDDPDNLQAATFALNNLGNEDYGLYGSLSNGETADIGPNFWKCNQFVADAYAIGAGVGYGDGGVPTNSTYWGGLIGREHPPTANDYADPKKSIPNFSVVGTPGLGDVVAYPNNRGSGHAAISLGSRTVIYASDAPAVKVNTIQGAQQALHASSVVFRRFGRGVK